MEHAHRSKDQENYDPDRGKNSFRKTYCCDANSKPGLRLHSPSLAPAASQSPIRVFILKLSRSILTVGRLNSAFSRNAPEVFHDPIPFGGHHSILKRFA